MGALSADEYADWLRPSLALARLPEDWGRGHAVDTLTNNLRVGTIRAVARRGILSTREGERVVDYHLIDAKLWNEDAWVQGEALWVTGDVSFRRGSRQAEMLGRSPEEWIEHVFTGVRFDPDGFAESFGFSPPAFSEERVSKPLSSAEMNRFISLYLEVWADEAREMKALTAAQSCYPDSNISRDPFLKAFRELRGPGRVGKPSKTKT